MIFSRSVLILAVTAIAASSTVSRPHGLRPRVALDTRDSSDSDAGSLDASLDYSVDSDYFARIQSVDTWQQSNISLSPSLSSSSSVASYSRPVTITITQTGRPIPTDEILIGLIATLALLYGKQLSPDDYMPDGGVRITFNAGLQHTISLEPLRGQRVTWGALADAIKQTGNVVRVKNVNTEFIFIASYGSTSPFLRGIVANPSTVGDRTPTSRQ